MRFPEDVRSEIEREQQMSGTRFSAAAVSLLREAIRMRRVPGVHFVEGVGGSRRGGRRGDGHTDDTFVLSILEESMVSA